MIIDNDSVVASNPQKKNDKKGKNTNNNPKPNKHCLALRL